MITRGSIVKVKSVVDSESCHLVGLEGVVNMHVENGKNLVILEMPDGSDEDFTFRDDELEVIQYQY